MKKNDYSKLEGKDQDETTIENKVKKGPTLQNHITYKDTNYIPYERNLLLGKKII